jgi:hypothetical protein
LKSSKINFHAGQRFAPAHDYVYWFHLDFAAHRSKLSAEVDGFNRKGPLYETEPM